MVSGTRSLGLYYICRFFTALFFLVDSLAFLWLCLFSTHDVRKGNKSVIFFIFYLFNLKVRINCCAVLFLNPNNNSIDILNHYMYAI